MKNFFYDLTPDVVLKAIEKSGLEPTGHCMPLNSFENRVYDLKLTDDSHIVSKFYRPGRWSKQQIQEEHNFLLELQADEIPVCAPLHFDDNQTIHEIEGIYYAIWKRTGGRAADELSDDELGILGRLLAHIHNNGASKATEHRITLDAETYGLKPLEFLLQNECIPAHLIDRYSNAVQQITDLYSELSQNTAYHRIHGDCHFGNLLNGSEGWYFLDFDDFLNGPAVQDIWMLTPARDKEGLRQRDVMLTAYQQFRDFDYTSLKLIELLRALRYIHYASWLAKRWEDPAFPAAFPHFGTVEYWENETNDLEDQIDFFYKNTADLPAGMQKEQPQQEEELTNKDYFWDWED